ncbi:MAG: 3-isopropylmalate dehydratase [Rhodospirillales bacterium]|nr:3-isopropylmalate dehydratase [Rhodospirillales bacterium]
MPFKALKYGDDISTDLIIAGKYTKSLNVQDLAEHAMEDLDPDFKAKAKDGAVVVCGKYFGCGSSREQAPVALMAAGVKAVAAKSFARIFYRNAINIGLPLLECDTDGIDDGDILDFKAGDDFVLNVTKHARIPVRPMPEIMVRILDAGGVVPFLKKHGRF